MDDCGRGDSPTTTRSHRAAFDRRRCTDRRPARARCAAASDRAPLAYTDARWNAMDRTSSEHAPVEVRLEHGEQRTPVDRIERRNAANHRNGGEPLDRAPV